MRLISDDALATITIWQESRSEPYEGKVGVGEVIRNRMKFGKYMSDGTVVGTVLKAKQFSGWNDTDPNRIKSVRIDDTDPIVTECLKAWRESETSNRVKGALYYMNVELVKSWNRGELPKWWFTDACAEGEVKIGDHTFRRKR